jgi:hypothetical protein
MSLCSRRFTGALGLDWLQAMSVNHAVTSSVTSSAVGMTASSRLLTRRVRRAHRAPGADAIRETRLVCGGVAGPKWLIHHFAVKALLTLI